MSDPQHLIIGEVLRPHGIRGELRLRLLTDYPERIGKLRTVVLGRDVGARDLRTFHVQGFRMNGDYGLLKLREVPDRNAAELLRELMVMVSIADAVPLEEGEFYLYQLIGLRVQLEDGTVVGAITEVLETGANDVYIIDSAAHGELLLPATEHTIISTDVAAGVVIVRPPDGFFPHMDETDGQDQD